MTSTETYSVERIRREMMARGSHWWDKDSMRFFGTRVCGGVFAGDGGIYFVTSEQPPNGPRKYSVRQYKPDGCDIDTVGEFCGYRDRRTALRAAEKLAGAPMSPAVPLVEMTDADQLSHDLTTHGACNCSSTLAACLIRLSTAHHRLMEDYCNGVEGVYDGDGNPSGRLATVREKLTAHAEFIGAGGVHFSGDPRGATVRLVCKNGYTNDFAGEGVIVPAKL